MSAPNQTASTSPLVIINYSHVDAEWGSRLYGFLKPAVKAENISIWNDKLLDNQQWHSVVGDSNQQWRSIIEASLAQAKVAVLLVSAEYLASQWVTNKEV